MLWFKTNCDKEKLIDVRGFVTCVLRGIDLTNSDTHMVVLAVDEICANLITHSNKSNPKEFIELSIIIGDSEVLFEITDYGVGFDYNNYKEPKLEEIIRKKRRGGLGIKLVKNIMDSIEFKKQDDKNTCRMIKKIVKRDD